MNEDNRQFLVGSDIGPSSEGEKEYKCYQCGGPVYLHDNTAVKLHISPASLAMCVPCLLKMQDANIQLVLPDTKEITADFPSITEDRLNAIQSRLFKRLLENKNKVEIFKP